MYNRKKGFTLMETLFSIAVISIIFVTFPTLLKLFMDTVFVSENKNGQELNRIYKDTKYSYLLTNILTINNTADSFTMERFDECVVDYTYHKDTQILDRTYVCPTNLKTDDQNFKVPNIDFFKVEETNTGLLKITVSSTYEDFNREYFFNKL